MYFLHLFIYSCNLLTGHHMPHL